MLAALLTVLGLALAEPGVTTPGEGLVAFPGAKQADLATVRADVTAGANKFRAREGRGALTANAQLDAAAQAFAEFMAETGKYGHEADGRQPADRTTQARYEHCIVAENIAFAFASRGFDAGPLAEKFVQGWVDSPPHRANLLDRDVTEHGVGAARGADGSYFAVHLFGRPKSAAIELRVANRAGKDASYALGDRTFDLPPRATRTHTLCRESEALTFAGPKGPTTRPARGAYEIVESNGALDVRAAR